MSFSKNKNEIGTSIAPLLVIAVAHFGEMAKCVKCLLQKNGGSESWCLVPLSEAQVLDGRDDSAVKSNY